METRNKQFGEAYKDKTIYRSRYPLSAKIYCCDHNEVFHRRRQCKASDEITWTCAMYLKNGMKACASPNIRESEIYSIFDDIIKESSIKVDNVSNILSDLYKNNKNNIGYEEEMKKYNKEKEKVLQKKDKLLELNIDGNISNAEFSEQNNRCNAELQSIEEKIVLAERKKKNFLSIEKTNAKLEKILKQKVKSITTKDKIIDLLLDKIVVSKINNDRNYIELNIFLNFSKEYVEKELKQTLIPTVDGFESFLRKEYEFKRGYNTTSTKRYEVKYKVNTFICL